MSKEKKKKETKQGKYPVLGADVPKFQKKPRPSISPSEYDTKQPVWRFSKIDLNGKWGWNNITKKELRDVLLPRLKSYETMCWHDIMSKASGTSHYISLDNIIADARKRLEEISQDDVDHLLSLTISGKRRLWGIKFECILYILWWDPNHEVCPSPLKHT